MKYYWRAWIWENGQKTIDLTSYLISPIFTEPHLDETIGSGEIILDSFPSEYNQAFKPKTTKIRIERYLTPDYTDVPNGFDYVVDSDQTEEYASCPEICCHRIQLIEPSVIAQGMHVDNISLTRELNDNDLNYKTTIPTTEIVTLSKSEVVGSGYQRPETDNAGLDYVVREKTNGTQYFTNSYRYVWSNTDSMNSILKNLNGLNINTVSFTIPTLTCQFLNGSIAETLFECPIRTKITRTTLLNNQIVSGSEEIIIDHFYNPINIQNRNDWAMYNQNGRVGLANVSNYDGEAIWAGGGGSDVSYWAILDYNTHFEKFPAMINTNDTTHSSKEISFTTTPLSQTEIDNKKSYLYTIVCTIEPYESGALVQSYSKKIVYVDNRGGFLFITWGSYDLDITTTSLLRPQNSQVSLNTTFYSKDMLSDAQPNPFLVKPQKYSCFDLIRKALLTVDSQIFDNNVKGLDPLYDADYNDVGIQYPIIIDTEWITRLKEAQLYETIFENKNLWEIFLQIGYYLHAIPQLKFATDGTDRFVLSFRQLGAKEIKNNNSSKITIFNSQNLSEYFTQLDSYVTNIFSPQNEVEEWLVCKTSDSSYLISNDTAELQTKYNITEIVEFDIEYNGTMLSALNYIFEKTVYNTLSAKTGIIPAKWAAIYYEMGTNKISGLNYVPPTANNDGIMALKKICGDLFGAPTGSIFANDFLFNDLKFHIKYKTQDTLRISQFKPNLYNFMKNSAYEKYPHHEQFYGQQDKIVDSERFSANLWGRLVRIANGIYQCNEYADIGEEKEVGDLVNINNDLYYVMTIENEYYNDIILQKVTYSKNFNQISQVVTVPSEPRFYEISERSLVRREVRLMDFFLLSTKKNTLQKVPNFIPESKWQNFMKQIIFTDGGQPLLPNFAYTRFKADKFRQHIKDSGEIINTSVLFPNSETETVDGIVQPKPSNDHKDVIVPLLHFPLRNAIVFEWDMDDNFKAGDAVDTSTSGKNDTIDDAYYSILPVRYCDVMGKADLFSFKLFNKSNWTKEQAQRLPFAETEDFIPSDEDSIFILPDNLSIGLDKDNREAISFNYQINLLTSDEDESDPFVIFSNAFGVKQTRLKMVLLNIDVSMFDETVSLSEDTIVYDNVNYSLENDDGAIEVVITEPENIDLSNVKSIVLYDIENDLNYAYIAKNVSNLDNEDKLQSWYIYPVFSN